MIWFNWGLEGLSDEIDTKNCFGGSLAASVGFGPSFGNKACEFSALLTKRVLVP